MIKKNQLKSLMLIVALFLFFLGFMPIASSAQVYDRPIADINISSGGIQWIPKVSYYEMTLTVSRPDGSVMTKRFDAGSTPYLDITSIFGNGDSDGSYTYELRITQNPPRKRTSEADKVYSTQSLSNQMITSQSGHFSVKGGMLVSNTATEGPSTAMDVVHADDVIVTGSLCVGFDCLTDGTESFGFDTIKMKENNIRIKFDDTSSTAGFPANDWQFTANDSSSGGANYLSIDDITGSKVPFKIIAGARSNSIFVSSTGRVGFGTAAPVLNLHIVQGDTPSMRLDQDTSSGWTAQVWDIAGNESNFFIRDVTGGSKLPFRIQPGAPTNTLTMKSTGFVGIGTWSPAYTLDVQATGTGSNIVATRTDGASFQVSAAGSYGYTGTRTDHPVRFTVNSIWKMQINGSGHLIEMSDGGYYDGTWTNSSSRKMKDDISQLSAQEAFDTLKGLDAVKFRYKTNKDQLHVGFIAEDVPDLVATKDRTALSPMDIVAVLTKVVQEQQQAIQDQQNTIKELKEKISQIENK